MSTGATRHSAPRALPGSLVGSLPGAWSEAGQLLASTAPALGDRAPINTALLYTARESARLADLSAVWELPQPAGRPDGRLAVRRMDDKGRLTLPLKLTDHTGATVPAESDGPVLTLFLPDSPASPAPARMVVPLRVDATGRLSVPAPVRHELGWSKGTDVAVVYDAEQRTVQLVAASSLEEHVAVAVNLLRRSASRSSRAVTADQTGFRPAPEGVKTGSVLPFNRTG